MYFNMPEYPECKEMRVGSEYNGWRLDVFLRAHYLDFSRSWLQKLIKKGNALTNSKKAKPDTRLKTGDVVLFKLALPPEISLEPDSSLGEKIKIIFENDDFLVIDKPTGLSAHPSSTEPKGTLVNWLLYHFPAIKSVGEMIESGNIRPGIVHRLDKDTSGVMVVAKNQKSFLWLKSQFQNHKVVKKYLALVNGMPEKENGTIDFNIARSRTDPTKNVALKIKTDGRYAITRWLVVKKFSSHTLLEITPETGRMHQIRVHLKAAGWPVSGDKKYGQPSKDPKHLGRMFLHAEYLSFTSPNGEKFSFNSPLPRELEDCLRNIPFVVR